MEKIRAKNAVGLAEGTFRAIVCTTCNVLIAEDRGRVIDVALITMAVRNHTGTPQSRLHHDIVTADLATASCVEGVHLNKNYTD